MNTFLYAVMILMGCWLAARTLQQQRRIKRQQQIIENATEGRLQINRGATFDLEEQIVSHLPLLRSLQRLDHNLSLKLLFSFGLTSLLLLLKLLELIALSLQTAALTWLLLMVASIVTPALLVKASVQTQTKKMSNALPYFIDLLAACVQAGMTIENAMKFIAWRSDDIDLNLSRLMQLLTKRAEVSGLGEALGDLYHSVQIAEFRMFCAILQQSVYYGTSLYESLIELSRDIREMQLLSSEEKIGKLSARMSLPLILFIMFPVTVLIAAPGILRIMNNALF